MEQDMGLARSTEVMILARLDLYARLDTLEMLATLGFAIATLEA